MSHIQELQARLLPFAAANAERCKRQAKSALLKHIRVLFGEAQPIEHQTKADQLYDTYRATVAATQHISINISIARLVELARTGVLLPTVPPNQWDRLPRDNVEKAFWEGELVMRPVYGALNTTSAVGAAPAFNPDVWIKLQGRSIATRTTFTTRNTYHLVNPALGDFNLENALIVLQNDVYLWDGVADCYLAKYGDPEGINTDDFIEAQIWGGVDLSDVDTVYVSVSKRPLVLASISAPDCTYGSKLASKVQEIW